MKTPSNFRIALVVAATFASVAARAQLVPLPPPAAEVRQPVLVDLQLTPSVEGFRAGISVVDTLQNRVRVWVHNGNEKKFSVTITGNEGYLWSSRSRENIFSQVFDLSKLEDGAYLFKVHCERETVERWIVIESGNYTRKAVRIE